MVEDSSQEFDSCLSHIQGVMPCLGPLNSPLLLHTGWMQMHLWPSGASESWETIPNEAKFIQKHILYISFLLIVLEPCYSPHHTVKPVFYNHPPLWSFFRPFLLFYFLCTRENSRWLIKHSNVQLNLLTWKWCQSLLKANMNTRFKTHF